MLNWVKRKPMCQGEIVTPLSPIPTWIPNHDSPINKLYLSPDGFKNPSEIIHTVLIGGFKSQIIAKKSISHTLTVSSRRYNVDSWSQSEWHETFLIWALFFWARQKHVDGIFGNTCHSPKKQEKVERNYVNLNPLSFFKSLMSWIWLFWTHKFVATERARVRTLKPHIKIPGKIAKNNV